MSKSDDNGRRGDPTDLSKMFQEWKDIFAANSDQELVDALNKEVGCTGWVSARGNYLGTLREEMERRGFDYSAVACGELHDTSDLPCAKLHIPGKRRFILEGKQLLFADQWVHSGNEVLTSRARAAIAVEPTFGFLVEVKRG